MISRNKKVRYGLLVLSLPWLSIEWGGSFCSCRLGFVIEIDSKCKIFIFYFVMMWLCVVGALTITYISSQCDLTSSQDLTCICKEIFSLKYFISQWLKWSSSSSYSSIAPNPESSNLSRVSKAIIRFLFTIIEDFHNFTAATYCSLMLNCFDGGWDSISHHLVHR